jgi:hypothetical protein
MNFKSVPPEIGGILPTRQVTAAQAQIKVGD